MLNGRNITILFGIASVLVCKFHMEEISFIEEFKAL